MSSGGSAYDLDSLSTAVLEKGESTIQNVAEAETQLAAARAAHENFESAVAQLTAKTRMEMHKLTRRLEDQQTLCSGLEAQLETELRKNERLKQVVLDTEQQRDGLLERVDSSLSRLDTLQHRVDMELEGASFPAGHAHAHGETTAAYHRALGHGDVPPADAPFELGVSDRELAVLNFVDQEEKDLVRAIDLRERRYRYTTASSLQRVGKAAVEGEVEDAAYIDSCYMTHVDSARSTLISYVLAHRTTLFPAVIESGPQPPQQQSPALFGGMSSSTDSDQVGAGRPRSHSGSDGAARYGHTRHHSLGDSGGPFGTSSDTFDRDSIDSYSYGGGGGGGGGGSDKRHSLVDPDHKVKFFIAGKMKKVDHERKKMQVKHEDEERREKRRQKARQMMAKTKGKMQSANKAVRRIAVESPKVTARRLSRRIEAMVRRRHRPTDGDADVYEDSTEGVSMMFDDDDGGGRSSSSSLADNIQGRPRSQSAGHLVMAGEDALRRSGSECESSDG
eukprot:TRINITY_DN680_c0_g1_i1.p1 TRINITY_DN680_c0_g1~~TRINITY_DN680_c0_g1_i1.p1  ORF type:complete len:505 (+),score=150.01 TRINITY_DN680_c0_g1_i1:222-1736(+)